MPEPRLLHRDENRLIWKTDTEAARRKARVLLVIGIVLLLAAGAVWPLFSGAPVVSFVLVFFAIAALRSSHQLRCEQHLVTLDVDSATLLHQVEADGVADRQESWPLGDFTAVALAHRTEVVVGKATPEGRVHVDDLIVRLDGPDLGATLGVFSRHGKDEAKRMAEQVAAVTGLPLVRMSIRRDPAHFRGARHETTMGAVSSPDLTLYGRRLNADESDHGQDREVPRESWAPMPLRADCLAPPDTDFFVG